MADTDADAALIEAVRAGDPVAYDHLFRRHLPAARRVASMMWRDRAEVDDLVAESFLRVLAAIRDGSGPAERFRPYLLVTLRNLAMDWARRRERCDPAALAREEGTSGVEEIVVDRLTGEVAISAFRSLPPRWRYVLWHTEMLGTGPGKLAAELDMTANGVAALAARAREGLRQAFLQEHVPAARGEDCRTVRRRLGAWTRGKVTARQRRTVATHLDGCPGCRRVATVLDHINGGLPALALLPLLGRLLAGTGATAPGGAAVAAGSGAVVGGGAVAAGSGATAAGSGMVTAGGGAVVAAGGGAVTACSGATAAGSGMVTAGGGATVIGSGATAAGGSVAAAGGGATAAGSGAVTGGGAVAAGTGATAAGSGASVAGSGAGGSAAAAGSGATVMGSGVTAAGGGATAVGSGVPAGTGATGAGAAVGSGATAAGSAATAATGGVMAAGGGASVAGSAAMVLTKVAAAVTLAAVATVAGPVSLPAPQRDVPVTAAEGPRGQVEPAEFVVPVRPPSVRPGNDNPGQEATAKAPKPPKPAQPAKPPRAAKPPQAAQPLQAAKPPQFASPPLAKNPPQPPIPQAAKPPQANPAKGAQQK
ncbi:sigma-70 family RNA polymerase sigma factor [Amycolatopsis thermophila]|uniref:RNA polymerase sigma factor (Sigma-70 family) n=1 Tax=Amycolatopsis thermophila TaxID=206084 RepID=A0ABU0F3S1_9PSEU|nr:sigma-70 family RNA polymerase sigma factor [Amycolatopsis thermophila]MDQ0382028.1 RNA polymerase sigma factor (sigma-70 family) [Amycolatopsis thermophila]